MGYQRDREREIHTITILNQKTSKFGRALSVLRHMSFDRPSINTEDGRAVHCAQKGSRETETRHICHFGARRKFVPFSLPKARTINQLQQEATKLRHNHTQTIMVEKFVIP